MKHKKRQKIKGADWSLTPVFFMTSAALLVGALLSIVYYRAFPITAIVQTVLSAVALIAAFIYIMRVKTSMRRFSRKLIEQQNNHSELFEGLTLPIAVFRGFDEIVWYNDLFRRSVLKGHDIYGNDGRIIIDDAARSSLEVSGRADVEYGGRLYSCYYGGFVADSADFNIVYFVDDTEMKHTAAEYRLSRPVIALMAIDSFDELTDGLPESEQARIRSNIEFEIEKWVDNCGGIIRRFSNNRYIIFLDERGFENAKNAKFDVLDRVHTLTVAGRGTPTLSIGVGRAGKDIHECELSAAQALDMAFGRGGDQAAVKNPSGYEFFGGVNSVGSERRTKVKARVISAALRELIEGSDSVFITGHKFADLDCVGAAYGLWGVISALGKPCKIAIERHKNLAAPLINEIVKSTGEDIFIDPSDAAVQATKKSLLIVVDVHRAEFLDSPELYKNCQTVVVIDHHRKTVDYIDNAVIFYHEPYASSACEMVAELLQYLGGKAIGALEANALLSGIMLDTRNFVLRTSARTFEASAYLRARGADPVEVKRYFAGSMEVHRERSTIVAGAEIYKNCAISLNDTDNENTRIASAQAADEMLNIENVDASFVVFKSGKTINISARSMGKVNVQLIMEELGGGGHHTMAAAQLEDVNEEEARSKLIDAIDKIIG